MTYVIYLLDVFALCHQHTIARLDRPPSPLPSASVSGEQPKALQTSARTPECWRRLKVNGFAAGAMHLSMKDVRAADKCFEPGHEASEPKALALGRRE